MKYDCIAALERAGISHSDATALRRIEMTLHRWHELECGNSDDYKSYGIVRGRKTREVLAGGGVRHGFEYAEDGDSDANTKPFMETHYHRGEAKAHYAALADKERGALKRLAAIVARYPGFGYYVQSDPRGAALYILRPGDIPAGSKPDGCYTRGIAVCK